MKSADNWPSPRGNFISKNRLLVIEKTDVLGMFQLQDSLQGTPELQSGDLEKPRDVMSAMGRIT